MPDPTALTVERLTPERASSDMLRQIVEMHCETFGGGVLSQLGPAFVQAYYESILRFQEGQLWIARLDGVIVGYLACTTNRARFENEHRAGAAKGLLLLRLLTFRMSPLSVVRGLRKQRLARHIADQAELLAIAIRPGHRRSGIGKHLVREWDGLLLERGIAHYVVFTDNEEGYQFYRRFGGECLFEFTLGAQTSAAFRIAACRDRST